MDAKKLSCIRKDGLNVFFFYVTAVNSKGPVSVFLSSIAKDQKEAQNNVVNAAKKIFGPSKNGGPILHGTPFANLVFAWPFEGNMEECERRFRQAFENMFPNASDDLKEKFAPRALIFLAKVSGKKNPRFEFTKKSNSKKSSKNGQEEK
mgnify:FL=1